MITQKELNDIRDFARTELMIEGRPHLSNLIIMLLDEFERVNRLGTEVREVRVITDIGTERIIWPVKEVEGKTCSDCYHFMHCKSFVGADQEWTACDWYPSRFQQCLGKDAL